MALAHREATVVWEGTLGGGHGTLRGGEGSDPLDGTTVDWAADEAGADGTTSPSSFSPRPRPAATR